MQIRSSSWVLRTNSRRVKRWSHTCTECGVIDAFKRLRCTCLTPTPLQKKITINSFRNFFEANLENLWITIQKYSYCDSLDQRNQTICHFLYISLCLSLMRFSTGLIFFVGGKGKGFYLFVKGIDFRYWDEIVWMQ